MRLLLISLVFASSVLAQNPAGVRGSQTTTVAAKLNSSYEAVADFGADPKGATDSTAAIQAAVNAANASGVCLHIAGSTTRFVTASVGGFTPFYKITGTITVPPGTCIRNDPNTTFQQQSTTADTFDFTGSFNQFLGGNIGWATKTTAGCGIKFADTTSLDANDNLVRDTRLINAVTSHGGSGICVSATHRGAYRNYLQNVQVRGFHEGISETGSNNVNVVGEGQISGWLSNNDYGAYLTYINDTPADVWIDGNATAGVYEDNAIGVSVSIWGGEGNGNSIYYGSSAYSDNCYDFSRVGACSQYVSDNSGGRNNSIGDMQESSTTKWPDGTRFCFGACYTTSNFPNVYGPLGFFNIHAPGGPGAASSNLMQVYDNAGSTFFRLNPYPYNVTTNPGGGALLTGRPSAAATFSGTTSSGSATVSVSNTGNVAAGMWIEGTNIPLGTFVAAVTTNTSIMMSQKATGSGTVTITADDGYLSRRSAGTVIYDSWVGSNGLMAIDGVLNPNPGGSSQTSRLIGGINSSSVPVLALAANGNGTFGCAGSAGLPIPLVSQLPPAGGARLQIDCVSDNTTTTWGGIASGSGTPGTGYSYVVSNGTNWLVASHP